MIRRRPFSFRWLLSFAVLLLAVAASGCAAVRTLEDARVLPKGMSRVSVGVGLQGGAAPGLGLNEDGTYIPAPAFDFQLRHGLGRGAELGLRLSPTTGVGLDVKIRLLARDRFHVALMPGLGVHVVAAPGGAAELGQLSADIRLLYGVEVGRERRFFVSWGMRVVGRDQFLLLRDSNLGGGGRSSFLTMDGGGFLGCAFTIGPRRRVRLSMGLDILVGSDEQRPDIKLAGGGGLSFDLPPPPRRKQ